MGQGNYHFGLFSLRQKKSNVRCSLFSKSLFGPFSILTTTETPDNCVEKSDTTICH